MGDFVQSNPEPFTRFKILAKSLFFEFHSCARIYLVETLYYRQTDSEIVTGYRQFWTKQMWKNPEIGPIDWDLMGSNWCSMDM